MRLSTPVIVLTLLGAACSIDDGGGDGRTVATETTSTTTTDMPAPTSTLPGSVGIVEVADEVFEIEADCYAPGAGELVATGLATPVDGPRVEVYVQAFLGQPYVGITVIDGDARTLYEPAIDRPLDISRVDDVLRVDDIALVTDLDLETGEGVDAGLGSVVIECRAYAEELPPGFAVG